MMLNKAAYAVFFGFKASFLMAALSAVSNIGIICALNLLLVDSGRGLRGRAQGNTYV